ncbi:hypothetical protein DPMN_078146 [Dreissena polymorpha]|uniref:Uncharacterized protein n=1 Tax=Dreissena polymorpha TaxID=45954 RepID=A0A9D3YLQ9_DREPO|nr:hypothetical protein DPMN_078146 [Dreissena polymorpha]
MNTIPTERAAWTPEFRGKPDVRIEIAKSTTTIGTGTRIYPETFARKTNNFELHASNHLHTNGIQLDIHRKEALETKRNKKTSDIKPKIKRPRATNTCHFEKDTSPK